MTAAINEGLADPYFEREFDWAMFIEIPDSRHVLNYPGSQLHPLTKMRVNFRTFARSGGSEHRPQRIYEELWYHKGKPIGSKRYNQLDIPAGKSGVIAVGSMNDQADEGQSVANALVRLLLDLQLKKISVCLVLVPEGCYDQVVTGLGRYSFLPESQIFSMDGAQMGIHLRSYPASKDQYFYFAKRG